jgi:hypothetical protein
MDEVMTRAEAMVRFPNEWILMIDPEPGWDVNFRGLVVAHSTNPDELAEKSKAYRPREIANFFAGPPIPPGTHVILGMTPRNYDLTNPAPLKALLNEVRRLKTICKAQAETGHG